MRKMLAFVLLAVFLSFGFVTMSFAQQSAVGGEGEVFEQQLALSKVMTFEGTVLSHDVLCHCIVVKTAMGNLTLQDDYAKFQQDYNRLKGLKIGAMIRGDYKTVNYINYAMMVSYK
jgi:hypothetical protein